MPAKMRTAVLRPSKALPDTSKSSSHHAHPRDVWVISASMVGFIFRDAKHANSAMTKG